MKANAVVKTSINWTCLQGLRTCGNKICQQGLENMISSRHVCKVSELSMDLHQLHTFPSLLKPNGMDLNGLDTQNLHRHTECRKLFFYNEGCMFSTRRKPSLRLAKKLFSGHCIKPWPALRQDQTLLNCQVFDLRWKHILGT